ncbi:TlpA disulfide reductase family protein [Pedobacter sp. MC2016-24]|uniref:TlpA family protein disulfide reductase n=1 Tax=Pedobacter sp. MC2016-24 TaxID=2780090 RepID=UPI0018812C0D|nr:TlpA disulfide reductase family protein [Pedobacter sp. MC2016-24]MBE9600249.1 TlpA family protein disulfide reductase [Pedobacter sp. MC2016-24]
MKTTIFVILALCNVASLNAQQMIIQTPEVRTLREMNDPVKLQQKLRDLGDAGTEMDYATLYTYYQVTNPRLADSVALVAISKYPKGYVALNRASRKLMVEDLAQQEKALEEMRKEFPHQDLSVFYMRTVRSFLEKKNAGGALKYLKLTTGKTKSEALPYVIGSALMLDANATSAYLDSELQQTKYSEAERMDLLYLQSQVLSKIGNHQKAFQSIQTYYDYTLRKSPQLTAFYYQLMSRAGRSAEAFSYLEAAFLQNVGGEVLKEELIAAYKNINPGKDVSLYITGLNKKLNDSKVHELEKEMISEKAPEFSVLDANGRKVSLTDFKGKTIVLDFWATWCGPCKRALPGMQATVEKYKDDPEVKFLFIHTWEKKSKEVDPTAAAKKYFETNNYGNLPLYMDLEDVNKVNPAVSAFKVTGIPAKFVIDGKGNIRFKKEGAGTDIGETVFELSAMIELAKRGIEK